MHGRKVVPAAENPAVLLDSESVRLPGCGADKSFEGIVLFEKVLRRKT